MIITATFTAIDIRHYVREFNALHGQALAYLSRDVVDSLLDAWIFRNLILRGAELSQAEAREVHRKMHDALHGQ